MNEWYNSVETEFGYASWCVLQMVLTNMYLSSHHKYLMGKYHDSRENWGSLQAQDLLEVVVSN